MTVFSSVHALIGDARYTGRAGGKYVTRDLVANTGQIGQFTAIVELHADFDAAAGRAAGADADARAPMAGRGHVDGVIRDFMEGGESLGNWRVTLHNASLGAIGMPEGTTPGMTSLGESTTQFTGGVSARVGASMAQGDWVGTFYGNDRADGKPESIAGAFEAGAAHAHISGAFGTYNAAE